MKKKYFYIGVGLLTIVVVYLYLKRTQKENPLVAYNRDTKTTREQKINKLAMSLPQEYAKYKDLFSKMSEQELNDTYVYMFDIIPNKKQLDENLKIRLNAISKKYKIFN